MVAGMAAGQRRLRANLPSCALMTLVATDTGTSITTFFIRTCA